MFSQNKKNLSIKHLMNIHLIQGTILIPMNI